ncbi:MAG: hypothetical protein AAF296_12105 [Pseudomonadota bacterium]
MLLRVISIGLVACCFNEASHAQALSLDVEAQLIEDVGATWQTVPLVNQYSSPVVVCTYNLRTNANQPATTRVRNVGSNSFELRVQRFEDSSAFTPSDVHCLIAEEGVNTLGDGKVIEARTVLSTGTNGNSPGWNSPPAENVAALVTGSYGTPVILGQVMSFNDNEASVFWTFNCSNRGTPATDSNMCVGKHIGMINDTRTDETLGFIVTSPGSGTVNDVDYAFARGPNSIQGTGNTPPYQYSVSGDFDIGVATMAAENGGNGGWAVLYGTNPLPSGQIRLAVEEETVAGDTSRRHISEELNYGVFRNRQTADLSVVKTNEVYSGSESSFAIPGSNIIYTLLIESTGSAPIDTDSVFLVDSLPSEVSFYNGDIDGSGPETGTVAFDERLSGLSFNEATDLGFSDAATRPASFANCTYMPSVGYDPNVRHVCFNPKGSLRAGTLMSDTDFTISFRTRIE